MKLRNKKTGKVYTARSLWFNESIDDLEKTGWKTLKEFCEDWEDVKEPLIKDEKIRKAVRAWAETNGVKKVTVEKDFSTYTFYPADTDRVCISVWTEPRLSSLSRGKFYSIQELCGEEEKE